MRKRNLRTVFLCLLCSVMLLSISSAVYAAEDTSTGRQPIRNHMVGNEIPDEADGDVKIHGEVSEPDMNNPSSKPSSSNKNTTQVGGGAYDPITGGKVVKTGDIPGSVWQYAVIIVLGGGLFYVLKKQKAKNE